MTEPEYILVRDLSAIELTEAALHKITPEVSEFIDADEYHEIVKKLREWRNDHYYKIELEEK